MSENDELTIGLSESKLAEEVKSIRRRANFFRMSGIGLLFVVASLLGFGGYVFFAANEITLREVSSTREAEVTFNKGLLENQYKELQILRMQSEELRHESEKQAVELRKQIEEFKILQESLNNKTKPQGE